MLDTIKQFLGMKRDDKSQPNDTIAHTATNPWDKNTPAP